MAREIDIIYKDDLDNGIYGAKVYLGTKDGTRLYANDKSAITYIDGTAKLNVSSMPLISQYVWLKDPNSDFESKQLYRSSKKSPYTFLKEIEGKLQVETIVVGKRKPPAPPKKSNIAQYLIIAGAVILGGFLIFITRKNKK